MRISGTNLNARSSAPVARRTAAGGFSLSDAEPSRNTAPVASLRTVGGIDALVALQGVDDAAERRSRGLKRGRIALDALDELKIGLLVGDVNPSMLLRLKASAAELREGAGDPGLDGVLAEIELRVAVEIAKLGGR